MIVRATFGSVLTLFLVAAQFGKLAGDGCSRDECLALATMKVRYRSATLGDRDQWVAMRYELWPDCPVERHQLEVKQLLSNDGLVVIAEIGDSLVGFAEASVRRDHVEGTSISPVPYLEGWYVRSSHRGGGIGAGLLAFVEQWAVERGFSELASDAELDNALSIRLHNKLGFREAGRSVSFVKKLNSS